MVNRRSWRVFALMHQTLSQELRCVSSGVLCSGTESCRGRHDSGLSVRTYRLLERVRREGVNVASRMEVQTLLTAHVSLSRPFPMPSGTPVEEQSPARLQDLVYARIVLSLRDSDYWIPRLKDHLLSPETSPHMLHVFSGLLRDAMDLMRELDQADDKRDGSYHRRPSIAAHPQNSRFDDWTVLVDLTRDAWVATAAAAPRSAYLVADSWSTTPYPLFRRLRFFCATHSNVVPPHQAVGWLIADDGWWLWSIETEREAIRLLVHLAGHLDNEQQDILEHAILAGPPSSMYEHVSDADFKDRVDRKTWLRLAKMEEAGSRSAIRRIGSWPTWLPSTRIGLSPPTSATSFPFGSAMARLSHQAPST